MLPITAPMWLYTRNTPRYSRVHTHHRTPVTLRKNTLGYSRVHTHHRTHITISKYTPRSSGVHTPHHRTKVTVPVLV